MIQVQFRGNHITEDGHLTGVDAVGARLSGVIDAEESIAHGLLTGIFRRQFR